MAGRQNWNNLLNEMPADRRVRIERGVRDNLAEMLLCEVRRLTGLTQQQVADSMGIKQQTFSALESQEDMPAREGHGKLKSTVRHADDTKLPPPTR